jgi:hypothetical protein
LYKPTNELVSNYKLSIYINSPKYFREDGEHLPKHVGEFMYFGNLQFYVLCAYIGMYK